LTEGDIATAAKGALRDEKVIWVSLQTNPREVLVQVREFDCHSRVWGRIEKRAVRQRSAISQVVFDLIVAAFSPLARIEEGQGKTCIARIRGGALALSPDSPVIIAKDDVLQPVFRQNDRNGDPLPKGIRVLPFTYLQVSAPSELNPSLLHCN